MKSYILNLTTYGMNGLPTDYDYTTAAALWNEMDELNETLHFHIVTLNETANGSLILTGEPTGTESTGRERLAALIEQNRLSRALERIADEYGAFELPARFLMGEPELNELLA